MTIAVIKQDRLYDIGVNSCAQLKYELLFNVPIVIVSFVIVTVLNICRFHNTFYTGTNSFNLNH